MLIANANLLCWAPKADFCIIHIIVTNLNIILCLASHFHTLNSCKIARLAFPVNVDPVSNDDLQSCGL